jgi:hypothetical protein
MLSHSLHRPLSVWFTCLALLVLAGTLPPTDSGATSLGGEADFSKLNVSVAVLDPGIPEDQSIHRDLDVFPRIRNIEALFLPFLIRQTLVETGEWGAVRVVPEYDPSAELGIAGTIVSVSGSTGCSRAA